VSSILSNPSDAETETTVPGLSIPAAKMAINPAADPASFEDYYFGLPGCPKLLACSSNTPWTIPFVEESGEQVAAYEGGRDRDTKGVFIVTRHLLREKLANSLRDRI
jgi:hypothetical protein